MRLVQVIRRLLNLVARNGGRREDLAQDLAAAPRIANKCPAGTQNKSCLFLQLPADVIYLVLQALEPQHRRVLGLTCIALRGLHAAVPDIRRKHLTRDQHLDYLACIARELPNQWVCEVCVALHPVDPFDTPEDSESVTCPRNKIKWRKGVRRVAPCPWEARYLDFQHRHVQLALKHLRLGEEQSDCGKRLLAVRHHDGFKTHGLVRGQINTLSTHYSVYPKAKVGPDGQLRYLTLSTWLYQPGSEPVSLEAMGDLEICPHMGFAPYKAPAGYYCPPLYGYPYSRSDDVALAIKAALAQRDGSQSVAAEFRGACRRCPTDFAVQAFSDCVCLRVWRDFGPESSPRSLEWRIQVADMRPESRNIFHHGPTLHHGPGTVRALYDGPSEHVGA